MNICTEFLFLWRHVCISEVNTATSYVNDTFIGGYTVYVISLLRFLFPNSECDHVLTASGCSFTNKHDVSSHGSLSTTPATSCSDFSADNAVRYVGKHVADVLCGSKVCLCALLGVQ